MNRWHEYSRRLAFGVLFLGAASACAQEFRPQRVLRRQPAITRFDVKRVREAWNKLNPSELVLGVTVNRESRAYAINMLTGPQREILNDTLGGKRIAATW